MTTMTATTTDTPFAPAALRPAGLARADLPLGIAADALALLRNALLLPILLLLRLSGPWAPRT